MKQKRQKSFYKNLLKITRVIDKLEFQPCGIDPALFGHDT